MEPYEFTDEFGETRRCGTIPETPEIPVGAAVEEQPGFQVWSDDQIRQVLSDPRRTDRIEAMRKAGFLSVFTKKANQYSTSACFPAGTLIRMGDGSQKPIEHVKLLDDVLTAEGRVRRVMKTMVRSHTGVLHRVCAWGNRHIRCTAEHPFLTKRGYKTAESLTNQDWVAIPRFMPETVESIVPSEYVTETRKSSMRRTYAHDAGSYNTGIPGKPMVTVTRTPLPELIVLNRNFGRLCGLYLAEGMVNRTKMTYYFHENEEETLAKEVADLWLSEFGVKANVAHHRGPAKCCEVKVSGTGWCHLFECLLGTGSDAKRVHGHLMSGPREFLEGLLSGWMAGDGLGEKDRCGGVTVSHFLAMNMFDIANALGHSPTIETLQVKINPKHKIKQRKLRYIIAWPSSGKPHPNCERYHKEDTVVWRRMHKVDTEPFSGFVYNLEVEDDHSYVAEGIGVHNCNGWLDANAFTLARWFGGNRDGVVFAGNYNYSLINGGRDAGSSLQAGFRTTTANGFVPVDLCPWNKIYRKDTQQFDHIAAQNKAVDPFPARTMAGFRTGMSQGFVGGAAIQVGQNLERKTSNGIAPVDRGPGNHAVVVLQSRLLNGKLVYDVYLDWGPQHGHDGFLTLTEDHFAETFPNHLFWLMPIGQWGG